MRSFLLSLVQAYRGAPVRLEYGRFPRFIPFGHANFDNHRLTFREELSFSARQSGDERQFHSLHRRFDTPQSVAAQRDFMGGENQAQPLLFALALEFGEGELIERQQEALFSRYFDFDRASVRIARPTFG